MRAANRTTDAMAEEQKPAVDSLMLKIKDQDGDEVEFKVKPHTKMIKARFKCGVVPSTAQLS